MDIWRILGCPNHPSTRKAVRANKSTRLIHRPQLLYTGILSEAIGLQTCRTYLRERSRLSPRLCMLCIIGLWEWQGRCQADWWWRCETECLAALSPIRLVAFLEVDVDRVGRCD